MAGVSFKDHLDQRMESFVEDNYIEFEGIYHSEKGDVAISGEAGYEISKQLPWYIQVDSILEGEPNPVVRTKNNYKSKEEREENLEEFLKDVEIKEGEI